MRWTMWSTDFTLHVIPVVVVLSLGSMHSNAGYLISLPLFHFGPLLEVLGASNFANHTK